MSATLCYTTFFLLSISLLLPFFNQELTMTLQSCRVSRSHQYRDRHPHDNGLQHRHNHHQHDCVTGSGWWARAVPSRFRWCHSTRRLQLESRVHPVAHRGLDRLSLLPIYMGRRYHGPLRRSWLHQWPQRHHGSFHRAHYSGNNLSLTFHVLTFTSSVITLLLATLLSPLSHYVSGNSQSCSQHSYGVVVGL